MKKLREKCKNKKGFTMVELIVVIVIILVLAVVLVPSLLKYVEKANKANCKADAATVMSQLQADMAAYQAGEGTDPDGKIVAGIKVAASTAGTAATVTEAKYTVANGEITYFSFTNGKYTATWYMAADATTGTSAGWTVTP